jgi:hypothetical protein
VRIGVQEIVLSVEPAPAAGRNRGSVVTLLCRFYAGGTVRAVPREKPYGVARIVAATAPHYPDARSGRHLRLSILRELANDDGEFPAWFLSSGIGGLHPAAARAWYFFGSWAV